MGVGSVRIPGKNIFEGVQFKAISVTRECMGVKYPGNKRYITLECPLIETLNGNIIVCCQLPEQYRVMSQMPQKKKHKKHRREGREGIALEHPGLSLDPHRVERI